VFCFAQNKNLPPPWGVSVILIYLLTTRRVPAKLPGRVPGNELPDNGSPTRMLGFSTISKNRWSRTLGATMTDFYK